MKPLEPLLKNCHYDWGSEISNSQASSLCLSHPPFRSLCHHQRPHLEQPFWAGGWSHFIWTGCTQDHWNSGVNTFFISQSYPPKSLFYCFTLYMYHVNTWGICYPRSAFNRKVYTLHIGMFCCILSSDGRVYV